ncbi:uncharacterized protein LOC109792938 [Cajanus cajan]|uniref:uncharacterized protein LOC109792938 n=1 Tax=Cajanus cajan TaxID=3821 RepID=UPI00098DA786|nr:uncharacterized protein LOC109792938 [Cajanus cajan]
MAGGRNDRAIADALQAMAQALGNMNQQPEVDWLERFQRNNPPSFRGIYNPDEAADWIFEVEKIFQAMGCPLIQKVTLATFMLSGEAGIWWQGTLKRMIATGTQVNWENFKRLFLEKYFPQDVRHKKQVEFLELKQGDDSVAEYVTKFEDLVRFCPMYDGVGNEEDKCAPSWCRAYSNQGPLVSLVLGIGLVTSGMRREKSLGLGHAGRGLNNIECEMRELSQIW